METTEQLVAKAKAGDTAARDEVVARMEKLCRHLAVKKIGVTGRYGLTVDDLMQVGAMAVMWAIDRFDPSRGFKFTTYALRRVHGAIQDTLRNNHFLQGGGRSRVESMMQLSAVELETDNGRPQPIFDDDVHSRIGFARIEMGDTLNQMLASLNKKERLAMLLYYVDGMTMRSVGETLGLSESRVSQMMGPILDRLRNNSRAEEARGMIA
jgi:RNA polymerase sigma factor for flagellar operon FliA